MRIDEATLVVVDTETTGTNARRDRLIEVAAVKVRGGRVEESFARLINPERTVPRRITRLTGISTAMVFDQPTAGDVLPSFLDFLGDGVMVAHNLNFDLGFLNAELDRLGRESLRNPTLCTLRLARRLLPGLPSKGLSSLIRFYGIAVQNRHRALGDASATAEVLDRLVRQVRFEHEVEALEGLLRFQHRPYASIRSEAEHVRRIRREILPRLPAGPGVYFMKDRHGDIIYIGKAKSLQSRVRSYFTGVEGHPARIRELVRTVRDVEWVETGSELGALLRESRLIKERKPRFNRALRSEGNRPFIRLDTTHRAPRVSVSRYVQNDGAEYFGPLGSRGQAEMVVAVVDEFYLLRECEDATFRQGKACSLAVEGRCLAPCEDTSQADAYAGEVERVRLFLTGQDRTVMDHLEQQMRKVADALDYEKAAAYRDWIRTLEDLMNRQEAVAAPVRAHNAVHVQSGDEPETVQLFLVRFGRLVDTLTLAAAPSAEDVERLRGRLAVHFADGQKGPERYLKREVDEVRILAQWLSLQRNGEAARWEPGLSGETFVDDVMRLVDRLREEPGT